MADAADSKSAVGDHVRVQVPPSAAKRLDFQGAFFYNCFAMEYIDCRTSEQWINDFVENKLVGEHLWQFLTHVEKCPECYEELETRYLVAEALSRLENGESFDLRNELKKKIKGAKRAMYFHYFNEDVLRMLEILSMIISCYALYSFLIDFFGILLD